LQFDRLVDNIYSKHLTEIMFRRRSRWKIKIQVKR